MVLLAALLASLLSIGAFALYGTVEVRCGQGHTVTAAFDWCDDSRHAVTHYHCPECDLDYESAPELAPGEAHKYDKNGVCTLCGHACAHTQYTDEYAWKDADCTGTFKCDFCGAAVTLTARYTAMGEEKAVRRTLNRALGCFFVFAVPLGAVTARLSMTTLQSSLSRTSAPQSCPPQTAAALYTVIPFINALPKRDSYYI